MMRKELRVEEGEVRSPGYAPHWTRRAVPMITPLGKFARTCGRLITTPQYLPTYAVCKFDVLKKHDGMMAQVYTGFPVTTESLVISSDPTYKLITCNFTSKTD